MTDWRDLPAGDELDILIARRVGWRCVWEKLQDKDRCFLIAPGTTAHQRIVHQGPAFFAWNTEDMAWKYDLRPHFSEDADAALTLLPPGFDIDIRRYEGSSDWYVDFFEHDSGRGASSGATLALAICRTYLTCSGLKAVHRS